MRIPTLLISMLLLTTVISTLTGGQFVGDGSEVVVMNYPLPSPPIDVFPMFRGDPSNTGNVTGDGPDLYDMRWSVDKGGYCSPVVMYDQVYVSSSRAVWCYDLDGNLSWSFNTGDVHWSSPLVHNGRVYITGNSTQMWCLDANATGPGTTTNYWTHVPEDLRDGCTSSPTTDGVRIFYNIETTGNGMIALWIQNGSLAWNASLDRSLDIESSPAYWNGLVYTGAGNSYSRGSNYVYCFYAMNGTLKWKYNVGRPVCSTPAIEYGRVYFGAQDRNVYCLDASGTHGSTTFYWNYALTGNVISSPAVAYGDVIIGDSSRNGYLYSLDAFGSGGTTTRNWRAQLRPSGSYGICSSPVVTPNYVYVGTTGNAMYALERISGSPVFSMNHSGGDYGISSSPAIFSGKLVYTSDDGNLYFVEQKNDLVPPRVNYTIPSDDDVNISVDVNITIHFTEEIQETTVTSNSIHLNQQSILVPSDVGYNSTDNYVWIKPRINLTKDTRYTVTVEHTVSDHAENLLDGDGDGVHEGSSDQYLFEFSTIPYSKPVITLRSIRALEDERKIIQLRDRITDEDTPFEELSISENSTFAEIDMGQLIVEYPQGVTYDLINLTVEDNVNTVYAEIEVNITGENDPPTLGMIEEIQAVEETDLLFDVEPYIFDADGDPLEIFTSSLYAKVENLTLIFHYPEGVLSEEVIISVSDGLATDATIVLVNVTPVNDAPVIDDVSGITGDHVHFNVEEDDEIVLTVHASDVDGPLILLVLEDNLDRLVFEPGNGRLTYSPIQEDVGNISIRITAHDGKDMYLKDTVTINITVTNVNDAPVGGLIEHLWGGQKNLTITVNTTIAFDEDGDPLIYSWGWGDGNFDAGALRIQHTYDEPGNYTIRLTISDGSEYYLTSLQITVTAPDVVPDDDDDIIPADDDDTNDDDEIVDDDDIQSQEGLDPVFMILMAILIALVLIVILAVVLVGIKTRREVWDDTNDPDAFMERYSRTVREVEE